MDSLVLALKDLLEDQINIVRDMSKNIKYHQELSKILVLKPD